MIGIVFSFGGEIVEVRINGSNLLFRTQQFGGAFAPIEGINIDKKGVIREFPDLKDNEDWKNEAIRRLKEKMRNMITEDERAKYIIEDLAKWGYIPLFKQKQGFRVEKLSK